MNTFEEIQRVRKITSYWFISIPIVSLAVWGLIHSFGAKDGDHINSTLILICSFLIAITVFYFFVNLRTDYNEKEIIIRYFPFLFFQRRISWNQISKAYVRKIDRSEFKATGLGAFPFGNRGKAYHLFSEYGLQIEMVDGDKILIGTRKPKSLLEFLKYINKL
jgi:hypothetical protein